MRLILAEKPSLARAIAGALPGPQVATKTHIRCGSRDVVAWCAGHILELAPPDAYGDAYRAWRLEHLPIVPRDWKLLPSAPELLAAIRGLLAQAERVVHAGDPDREGQLLVDEVLQYLGYRGPVDRLLVRDLNPEAVRRQLGALEPNATYRALYESALARQRADWLYGMNLTRLYTVLGRAAGYDGVLSVGRVQTPVLGLIVARDRAIATFQPVPYFVLTATMRTDAGETFRASWVPGPAAQEHLDEDKRLLRREIAQAAADRVQGQQGTVVDRTPDKKSEPPPLSYALADLQIDAGKRLGMTAQDVLDACQRLYETHRLLTYPRSDWSHLPEAHHAQAPDVLASIARHAPSLATAVARADRARRSKAWNDRKVTAHHAIIPTPNAESRTAAVSRKDLAVYELVATRYLAQFYPHHEYLQTRMKLEVVGEAFVASGRQVLVAGWRELQAPAPEDASDAAGEDDSKATLPPLERGDRVTVAQASIADKRTQAPKAFTDASLIAAMCSVGRFVKDPAIRKILTETDGIGTPATRAAILETLFARRYVTRVGKTIVSTETGRAFVRALPEVATTPDITAIWEAAMRAITERQHSLDDFLARVCAQLRQLVAQGRALGAIVVPSSPAPTPPLRTSGPPAGPPRRRRRARTLAPR